MLKLLIVDDEYMTREGIVKSIAWEELGITIVGQAVDGLNALKLALQTSPDLILSDVRMPVMDGIEFATQIREQLPQVQIIFLSGYSDKEYLKSAIKLQAVEYVEKPVVIKEVIQAIKKAAAVCLQEKEANTKYHDLENRLTENKPLIKQRLAIELLMNTANPKELGERLQAVGVEIADSNFILPVIVQLNRLRSTTNKLPETFRNEMLFKTEKFFNQYWPCSLYGLPNQEHLVIFFFLKKSENLQNILNVIRSCQQLLENVSEELTSISIGVGIKLPLEEIQRLEYSYQAAVKAAERQFFQGTGDIYFAEEDQLAHVFQYDESYSRLFSEYLKKNQTEELIDLVQGLVAVIKPNEGTGVKYIRNIFLLLLIKLYEQVSENGLFIPENGHDREFLWETIHQFHTLEEIGQYLIGEIRSLATFHNTNLGNKISRTIHHVINYIQQNYMKPITIKQIAESVYLTHTYLCLLFKKETGKTINQYLTEVRIDKSKDFLLNRKYSIYEISEMVGFSDQNYYTRLFKKLVGITPSEYREQQ